MLPTRSRLLEQRTIWIAVASSFAAPVREPDLHRADKNPKPAFTEEETCCAHVNSGDV